MDKLAELIATAAERLGLEAVRIWPQIVLVTWVKAVTELALVALLLCVASGTTRWGYARYRRLHAEEPHPASGSAMEDAQTIGVACTVGGLVVGLIFLVVFMANLAGWVAAIVAPEAVTVMRLVGKP